MDVHTLKLILRPILTDTSVWNTGETGNINGEAYEKLLIVNTQLVSNLKYSKAYFPSLSNWKMCCS